MRGGTKGKQRREGLSLAKAGLADVGLAQRNTSRRQDAIAGAGARANVVAIADRDPSAFEHVPGFLLGAKRFCGVRLDLVYELFVLELGGAFEQTLEPPLELRLVHARRRL